MLNLSSSFYNPENRDYLELSDRQTSTASAKIKLPRHISSLESSQHSRHSRPPETLEFLTTGQFSPHQAQARVSNQDLDPTEATNLAVNILRYQLKDAVAQQKHLENVRNNLQHRLAIARTEQNYQLITMLQEESRQLEASKASK